MPRAAYPVWCAILGLLAPGYATAASLLPVGVADPAGRTGFLANPSGGIDAVDLATGDLLWDSSEAHNPILAADDHLYAWAPVKRNSLRVLVLDLTHKGQRLLESEPVEMPDGANVEEPGNRSFAARWRLDRTSLILNWEARSRPGGTISAQGHARIDVESGKVETARAEKPAAPAVAPHELEKAVVRWQAKVGETAYALVMEESEERQKLSLWSWDPATGKAATPKELLAGKRLVVLPTVDERYLCLRDASAGADQGTGPEERKKNGWSIFAVETGERVARVPCDAGTQAAAVVGPHVFFLVAGPIKSAIDKPFVQPRTLKAVDLKSGKGLWERPVEGKRCAPPSP